MLLVCLLKCMRFCVVIFALLLEVVFIFKSWLGGVGECVCVRGGVAGGGRGGGLSDSFFSFLALGVWSKTESLVERYREMPRKTIDAERYREMLRDTERCRENREMPRKPRDTERNRCYQH